MWFLTILTYFAFLIQIVFATVSIASALYYLAELVEEYTVAAKKCVWWMNSSVLIVYVLFGIFENFPYTMILSGVAAQIVHFVILIDFPYVTLTSPAFILGVIFIILNHYLAFSYFASVYHSFSEVLAYFTLCLWLVPFALFISLSANENVLPTTTDQGRDVVTNYFSKKGKKYSLLSFFNFAKETLLPQRVKKGF
ncbi:protein TEX261 [Onthophagus taurus]|uniref:protein TEX261 n=1 Tax=Onthophagus taurus TaxID=166361 RepID=UPI000C202C30|nr:protein TEX261 [Onthophagus taurus]XP_022904261.1 protein TEX261 [Onthophagus taurus]